jgi:serine/alanine adding enzyme
MVTRCSAADDATWDAYVATHPNAQRYHLTAWRRIIESAFGHHTYYLMSRDAQGRTNGVLPLGRVRSRLFGDFLVSLPYVNYAGCCADSESIEHELENAAVVLARKEGVAHLELRTETPGGDLHIRAAKVAMRLPLPAVPDKLWASFSSRLRNQVRRAEREQVTVQLGREDQVDAFYDVFAENMRDLGTPVYTKHLFQSVIRELPDSTWIMSAYHQGRPVAAAFLVGFRDAIEVPWSSALRAYGSINTNELLYWHLLKFACERGYQTFDFGRSTPESGPFHFKRKWGALPTELHWRYWVPAGAALPELSPQNPRYQLAVRMWKRLPLSVTRVIGPSIVRNIP